MPLTYNPETGSGTDETANGYASLAYIRAYNAQRGIELPTDEQELIALATKALDLLESYEPRWRGARALPLTQPLSWPRSGVTLFGAQLNSNDIPMCIKNAHAYLTGLASTTDLDFAPVQDTRAITKEVIGPLETDYSTSAGSSLRPIIPQLDAMLAPVLNTFGSLRVSRA